MLNFGRKGFFQFSAAKGVVFQSSCS